MEESVKAKQRKFRDGTSVGGIFIVDGGYNNFRYLDGLKRYRVLDTSCIHYVFGGSGDLYIGNKYFRIESSQMFVMSKGASVMYYPDGDDPWRYAWLSIGGADAERYISMMGFSSDAPVRDISCPYEREREFTELFSQELSMSAAYYKAMAILFDTVAECSNGAPGDDCIRNTDVVERAKDIIHLNYDNPDFSVGMLDKIMHVSHSYICKLFKEQTNITAASYLLSYRLVKAAELASVRECPVKELCARSGFSDELYFMKKFKERYGVTVKEYMRNHGN